MNRNFSKKNLSYREALREGLKEVLLKDEKTFLIGEDIGAYGGTYAVTMDFLQELGPEKIMDAPLSEAGFTGLAIGAALGGLKPIVEIMTVNFSLLALDQIINSAAFMRYMSGGQLTLPLVIRLTTGGGRQLGAQHSNSFEGWLAHIPGLKILAPATVEDARYMLGFAINDPNPVLIFEHAMLFGLKEECDDRPENFYPYQAKLRKTGKSLTVISYGGMLSRCLQASEELLKSGLDVEVIDLRCLRPLDEKTIFKSISKTRRVLIVDEDWKSGGLSAEISARIMENCFSGLDYPVQRLCRREVPMAYAKHMEDASIPQIKDIIHKMQEMLV
ncbi:MAG: alpha-ketoacid dehydrogenase subunit beta [Bdellovibrio sp.]|nr:alpha-ketoacid dehydrogenase subunit beta [Bdellovibrio sp.]